MHHRFSLLGVAALMFLGAPIAWAQVDTSEGGGEEFQQQEYGTSSESSDEEDQATGESLRAQTSRDEIANIKTQMRLTELIEANRLKLIELENRVRTLEEMHGISDMVPPKPPAGQSGRPYGAENGRGGSAASAGPLAHPNARPAAAANNDSWRYRRFQGRWWYWTPEGRWVYWTGQGWTASGGAQATRR